MFSVALSSVKAAALWLHNITFSRYHTKAEQEKCTVFSQQSLTKNAVRNANGKSNIDQHFVTCCYVENEDMRKTESDQHVCVAFQNND